MEAIIALAIIAVIIRVAIFFLAPNIDNFLGGHGSNENYCAQTDENNIYDGEQKSIFSESDLNPHDSPNMHPWAEYDPNYSPNMVHYDIHERDN